MGPGPGDTARQPALWNGFANMASLAGHAVTIARGEGAWVFDTGGRAYLDAAQPLPEAPWFEPGARWSARRVLLHVIAETAQHAGHADIMRESLDGAKTMG